MKRLNSNARNVTARNLNGFSARPVIVWRPVPEQVQGLNPRLEPAEAVRVPLMKYRGIRGNRFYFFLKNLVLWASDSYSKQELKLFLLRFCLDFGISVIGNHLIFVILIIQETFNQVNPPLRITQTGPSLRVVGWPRIFIK